MGKLKLVVIGNGMAGVRCVEEIYQISPDIYDITIIGSEPSPNYNRIMLSKVLQGDASFEDIILNDWDWYKERAIRLLAGQVAARIDVVGKKVETASGVIVEYDKLILATGSSAFIPQITGAGKPGVIAFRSLEDCRRMVDASRSYQKAAVIGGGLLGLEAARGLLNLGMEVQVVQNASFLMNRQLDRMAADILKFELEKQGMRFLFNKHTERIVGRKRAEGILFSDGTRLSADLIVMAVGIRPNVELGKSGGIHTNRAFVVSDYMETNVSDVFAVGECAEHDGIVYGLVAPLYEQGKVLAKVLCGKKTEPYRGSVPYAQLKISGIDVFSAGSVNDSEAETAYQLYDRTRNVYKKVTMIDGKIAGAVLYGDISEGNTLLGYLKRRTDVSVLSRAGASSASNGGADEAAASMSDQETVCNCNGVTKAVIVKAVRSGGLQTLAQVRERTKASGSCGGCKPMVAAIIELALTGGEAEEEPRVCGCTSLGHSALKEALKHSKYSSAKQVMAHLGWNREGGCAVCRPAIIYYLGEVEAAGAEVGSNYDEAINGYGLRIKLGSGVESGSSEARRVEWIGAELEGRLELHAMPHPVSVAIVSGINGGVGLPVRDVGIAEAPAGWEVYAGGHAEYPVKQAQLIAAGLTVEDALELGVTCLLWYGDSAFYREPVWKWLERQGMLAVREKLLDPEARDELQSRRFEEWPVKAVADGAGRRGGRIHGVERSS
ncbi:nitrite reductase large subunit NirB [Paenibacillus mendelii]|uniref:Nitrite reductase large subunit NirB n=1 Tax=Paenibacillus mendelii TaxID=206163 RepID=A0ABV6J601_9BACL|nr:nitrite reductase large subunit NirB [Paenibacillus mendelii]MCQ6560000.1 nitrite reductase large subunit NirB [Paenibacillus mendelii]